MQVQQASFSLMEDFPNSSVFFKIISLVQVFGLDALLNLTKLSYSIHIPLLHSQPSTVQLDVPSDIRLHPDTIDVQAESEQWGTQTFRLFPGKYEKALKEGIFGWLCGLCYSNASKDGLRLVADWITALFCVDDKLDSADSSIGSKVDIVKQRNNMKIRIMSGQFIPKTSDKELFKAFRQIYERLQPYLKDGITMDYFLESLTNYLRSTESEAKDRSQKRTPSEESYIVSRRYTGGAINAFAVGFLVSGVNIQTLFNEYYWLRDAISLISDCVGLSNDIVSAPKEVGQILKELGLESSQRLEAHDCAAVKSKVFMNLVLIKWKAGKDFDTALKEVQDLHNKKMLEFVDLVVPKMDEISQNGDLIKVMSILLGWANGNPAWIKLKGRCSSNFVSPSIEHLAEIVAI